MKMADVGWVWEGQGLNLGVHPSIFGVGEGAAFFGLRRVHFMFHPLSEVAMRKLADMEEVVCDISKWGFRDTERGGSENYVDARIETVCTEAERVSRLSRKHPNVTGAMFDDLKGLLTREGMSPDVSAAIGFSLKMYNASVKLWTVAYSHELDEPFWQHCRHHVEVANLWIWRAQDLGRMDEYIDRCRELFPGKPVVMGCYLRDYSANVPMPMDLLQRQWEGVAAALQAGRLDGYAILGTVLLDTHMRQATWVRDFIRAHS